MEAPFKVYLQENHRASRKLVKASNRLISRNKLRVSDKHIYSKNEEGEFPLLTSSGSIEDEAKEAARIVRSLP